VATNARILLGDDFFYTLSHREFYESLNLYEPNVSDFISVATSRLPPDWRRFRSTIWYHCQPPEARIVPQGWKIQLSATLRAAAVPVAAHSHQHRGFHHEHSTQCRAS
jgi:hypothetical protein